jgi:hypothetical protein
MPLAEGDYVQATPPYRAEPELGLVCGFNGEWVYVRFLTTGGSIYDSYYRAEDLTTVTITPGGLAALAETVPPPSGEAGAGHPPEPPPSSAAARRGRKGG